MSKLDDLIEWSRTPTEKPKRTTRIDVAEEWERRRAEKEQSSGENTRSRVGLKVGASMGLAALGIGIAAFGMQAKPVDRSAEINDLNAQISSAQHTEQAVPDANVAKKAVSALQEKSQKVADLQNEYRGWQPSTAAAQAQQDAQKSKALYEALAQLVPSKAAGRWFSPLVKDGSGGANPMPADQYKWESVVTYDVTDTSALPIAWLCKGSDGTLLAWTTATYDAGSGTFSKLHTGVTSAGARLLISDDTAHANGVG